MYKKFIFAAILIAFACVQLGYTLNCFECNGAADCKHSRKVVCNQRSANNTNYLLNQTFHNVPNTTSGNFNCLHLNYTQGNIVAFVLKGCVYRESDACMRSPKEISWERQNCTECSGNLCNGHSPAGTYSSSFYTLLGSAIIVLVAKMNIF